MQYITEDEVDSNLTMADAISAIREAFKDYALGGSSYTPRVRLPLKKGSYVVMPGVFGKYKIAGLKTYVGSQSKNRHVVVFDTESGDLLAVIESSRMGQLKTGALPAMVSSILRPEKNQNICIVGSGMQARGQLEGLISVYEPESITVYSRNPAHSRDFAGRMSSMYGVDVRSRDTPAQAMKDATVVSSITNSDTPVFFHRDMGVEYHLNLCGANVPSRMEAGDDVLPQSDLVVVEDMAQAMLESSEIMSYRKNKPDGKWIELRDLMGNTEIPHGKRTAFKSMGVGLEDIAVAHALLKKMEIL